MGSRHSLMHSAHSPNSEPFLGAACDYAIIFCIFAAFEQVHRTRQRRSESKKSKRQCCCTSSAIMRAHKSNRSYVSGNSATTIPFKPNIHITNSFASIPITITSTGKLLATRTHEKEIRIRRGWRKNTKKLQWKLCYISTNVDIFSPIQIESFWSIRSCASKRVCVWVLFFSKH